MAPRGRRREARFYELYCIVCGKTCTEQESSTRCPSCGKPLAVRYDYAHIRARLNRYSLKTSPIKALKYLDFYPILNLDLVVSLDEGGTPLYRCHRLAEGLGGHALCNTQQRLDPTAR